MQAASRLALGMILTLAPVAEAIDISSCDSEVSAGQVGVLTGDLDCSWDVEEGSYGVELGRNATLDMQGHTITGPQWAVSCPGPGGKCTVTSTTGAPGTLIGAEAGIWSPTSKVVASHVQIIANEYGISNNPKTTLADVTFMDNGFALTARSLKATDVTVTGHCNRGYCMDLGKGTIDGLVTADTGESATVLQVSGKMKVSNATMSGSPGQVAIFASGVRITNSDVHGHGIDLAARSLRVQNVTCDHSRRFGKDGFVIGNWGVCAGD
jgi:hypothetical protein